jgi:hypothetical protein
VSVATGVLLHGLLASARENVVQGEAPVAAGSS